MTDWDGEVLTVGAATAIGLLIGIERGWSFRQAKDGTRIAGVRTFTLLGLLGGLSGLVSAQGQALVGAFIMSGAALILVIGYARNSSEPFRPDATTVVAGLVTLILGFVAGSGRPTLGIAFAAMVMLLLALKQEAHTFIAKLGDQDIKALARFAVIAVAVLPFLPDGDYGPYDAWNPRQLWLVVVLVTGFSFAGHVANRVFGARHGTLATAIIGGAYSSTAVTQALAQRLSSAGSGGAECAGIALATTIMYLRVIILVAVLATPILKPLALILLPALAAAAAGGLWLYRRSSDSNGPVTPANPIALIPAFGFVLFVACAAVAARWAEGRFGEQGIATLILIMGSLDVDAAIVTVGGMGADAITPNLAALALGGTVLANMTVKIGIVLAYARSSGWSAIVALGISMAVLIITLGIGLSSL